MSMFVVIVEEVVLFVVIEAHLLLGRLQVRPFGL